MHIFKRNITQNEVICMKIMKFVKKAILIIDDVTMTSIWRHNYVYFHIFRAKIENFLSLESCKLQNLLIYRWTAFTKF